MFTRITLKPYHDQMITGELVAQVLNSLFWHGADVARVCDKGRTIFIVAVERGGDFNAKTRKNLYFVRHDVKGIADFVVDEVEDIPEDGEEVDLHELLGPSFDRIVALVEEI